MNPSICTDTGGSHLFDYTKEEQEEIKCRKCGASYLRVKADEDRYNKIKEAFSLIVDACNTSGVDFVAEAIHDGFVNEHRTLQQKCMHAIQQFITKVSKDSTDGRNEATRKWCEKVASIEAYFPFI